MKQKLFLKCLSLFTLTLLSYLSSFSQDSKFIKSYHSDPFIDVEGNTYKTIKIGNQIWMAENLQVTTTSGGDKLEDVFVYSGDEKNAKTYGRLYRLNAAIKACPDGWHAPTKEDWEELINYLGGSVYAGGKMKSINTQYWNSPNIDATNESQFNVLPAGMYDFTKVYQWIGKTACFLSATKSSGYVKFYYIENSSGEIKSGNFHPDDAASVRFVKN